MAFTTSGQEMEWALFLQPRSPYGARIVESLTTWTICTLSVLYALRTCRNNIILVGLDPAISDLPSI